MRSGKPATTRRAALAGAGWVAAAVLATLIGIGGVRLIGDSLTSTPGGVLEQRDVAKALASQAPSPEPTPSAGGPSAGDPSGSVPASPSGSAAGEPRAFSSAGGSVVAGCRDGQPYLVSWSPSPGYRITRQETESEHADVRFEGTAGRSEIRVTCSGDTPVEEQHGD